MLVPVETLPLPPVKTIADCANLNLTVIPFLPQLYTLPQRILEAIQDPEALKHVYLSTNPLVTALAISLAIAPIFLIVSEINKNYSQVDRFWSIIPSIYAAHFALWAHSSGLLTERLYAALAFSAFWSIRLTFNYWRKGGYSIGSEDYRWEVLRQNISPGLMFVFNVVFISFAQSILLFLVTTPIYILLLSSYVTGQQHMSQLDTFVFGYLIFLVLFEFAADQQQWNYQQAKKLYKETGTVPSGYTKQELDLGFVTYGLWSMSRHPNFVAEQAVWTLLYVWSCIATKLYVNWTIVGALSYIALFQASTWFTEWISGKKYPEYKRYQKSVGMFLPNPFKSGFQAEQAAPKGELTTGVVGNAEAKTEL